MLNLNCVICAELFTASDDVYVTSCGHMFHIACLSKWLERSKTCPQCRNKCSDRNIIRVYFNLANLDSSRIDVGSLQEQLDNANLQLNVKEKELQKANNEIKDCKETQKKCTKTIAGLEKELQSKNFIIQNYVEKTKTLESQVKLLDNLRKECKILRDKIETMDGVNTLLTSTTKEAEDILHKEKNPKILSCWVATLRRELKLSLNKKADMRNTLKAVQTDLRKEIEQRKIQEERNSELESENYQLLEKIKCLDDTVMKYSNNGFEKSLNNSIGLNTAYNKICDLTTTTVNNGDSRCVPISRKIKDTIKKIEESSSPYLNIKTCNVLLPPLLLKNNENRMGNKRNTFGNKLPSLEISPIKELSPIKTNAGAIRKTKSDCDLNQKYSILKKPRKDFSSKPLATNFVYNGFGGSERVDPFDRLSNSDDEYQINNNSKKNTEEKPRPAPTASIHSRLKRGGLRNIKFTK